MVNKEVLTYIRNCKQKGISENDIKTVLLNHGWQLQSINEAFFLAENQASTFTPNTDQSSNEAKPSTINIKKNSSKTPLLVIITSWLMLLGGILGLFGALPFILLGWYGKEGIVFLAGIVNLVNSIGNVIVSFGIRHMKRWALYAFTALTVFAGVVSIYSFFASPEQSVIELAAYGIQILVLINFWMIAKKFT